MVEYTQQPKYLALAGAGLSGKLQATYYKEKFHNYSVTAHNVVTNTFCFENISYKKSAQVQEFKFSFLCTY